MADPIKWLIDAYADWAKGEGIPIVEGAAIDLFAVETKPWARVGAKGALVHASSRGDLTNMYVIDIEPGTATVPQRHLYEEVMFVIEGSGNAVVERASA